MKQVGYRRFHLAIISFKRPKWEFFQRVPPARSDMCDSWPNNQGKKKKEKKKKAREGWFKRKKKGGGGEGRVGLYPNKNLLSELVYPLRCLRMEHLAVEDVLNQLLRALSFKKKNRTKQF